jgi:uncharacterized protein YbjT (DUF2867 family)
MILVTGGTGRVGRHVVAGLLDRGVAVRVLTRDPARARDLLGDRVELVKGDFSQPATLAPAVAGVERVYLVTPGAPDQVEQERSVVQAARRGGVSHIVKQSVIGASTESPSALVRWHAEAEKVVEASGLSYTLLRPTLFMQLAAELVGADGAIYSSVGGARLGFVDTRDVAAVAIAALTSRWHEGKTYTVTGPETLTWHEAAEHLSSTNGPVRYVPVTEEAARASLASFMPEWRVEPTLEFNREIAGGLMDAVSGAVEAVTGKRPRSFADFVRDQHAAA